jgi:squalene-hopene/tetraprenyl-beta-curcumene cyclase
VRWLLEAQNADGGWGGSRAVSSSIEETGVVLSALGPAAAAGDECQIVAAVTRGRQWLIDTTAEGTETQASPVGLYFARLWYYEELYPMVFALQGLAMMPASQRRA